MPTHTIAERRKRGFPTKAKAKKIQSHGAVGGRPLSGRQRGLFGLIAGGGTPTQPQTRRLRRRRAIVRTQA